MASVARCLLMAPLLKCISSRSMGYLCRRSKPRSFKHTAPFVKTGGLLCAQAVIVSQTEESPKLKAVDPQTLTSSYLISQAAAANVDSATTLLNQTAATLIEIHEKYVDALDSLLKLQDLVVESFGSTSQEDRVWDAVLVVRKKVADIKAAKDELEILFRSAERLVNNAAEAAFLSGAEYACTLANEQLYAVRDKLNAASQRSQKAERSVNEREAWVINETAKRDKELKEKKAKEGQTKNSVGEESQTSPTTPPATEPRFGAGDEVKAGVKDEVKAGVKAEVKDWFSVVLDEDEDSSPFAPRTESTDSEEQEDERKWANTK